MSYDVSTTVVGHVLQREVTAVTMPRQEFLGIVLARLERPSYRPIHDIIMPVAETMERFPFSTWIDSERGCGCLVGEYLIAASLLERVDFTGRNSVDLFAELHRIEPEHSGMLVAFGSDVDTHLRGHLRHRLGDDLYREVVATGLDLVLVFED